MVDNLTIVGKIGETGKVISVVLKSTNENGQSEAQDLTGYTQLKMQVETSQGEVIMNAVACVADGDQVANKGLITCTTDMTPATHSNIKKGKHRVEFSGLNGSGKKRYWPMNANQQRTYGTFVIQDALS